MTDGAGEQVVGAASGDNHVRLLARPVPTRRPEDPARTDPSGEADQRFFGRDRELATLGAIVDRAMGGAPALALVLGEAGIGKTRLVDELTAPLRARGIRTVRGEADVSARKPFGLWSPVCRALQIDAEGDPELPPTDRRWEQMGLLAAGLIATAPVVVVLEDLHWADDLSVWLLERLPRELAGAPVAIIVTGRDDEPRAAAWDSVHQVADVVTLVGLDVPAVGRLVASLSADVNDLEALWARTGGNPLFVRELVRLPERLGGHPRVIEDLLTRSLGRFGGPVGEALAVVALAGPEAPVAVTAAALGIEAGALLVLLDDAVGAGVLAEASFSGARFRHELLADAARRIEAPDRKLVLHRRLADAWLAVGTLEGRAAAAGHRLEAAASGVEAAAAAHEAMAVAAELRSGDDHGRAVSVLRGAADATERALAPSQDRAAVLVALADALWWLGSSDAALGAFESAAALAAEGDDPLLLGTAEVGAARRTLLFLPAPERTRRLFRALDRLPVGDRPVRVELLGRLAVVGLGDPDAFEQSQRRGDEAVAMARRLGQPLMLAGALLDRHLAPFGPDGLDERAVAAEELVTLSELLGRPDLALIGNQWRFADRLDRGDLLGAHAALERVEFLAELLPSPAWRYSAMVRRVTLHCADGHRSAALDLMAQAVDAGSLANNPHEIIGIEMSGHTSVALTFGQADPRLATLFEEQKAVAPAVALVQIRLGTAALAIGERAAAERVVSRYGSDPGRVEASVDGASTLRMLGGLVADLGATDHAGRLRQALLPLQGRMGSAFGLDLQVPIDDVIGRLALLEGDAATAVLHLEDATTLVRAMPSRPLLAHCLAHLAAARNAVGDAAGATAARTEAEEAARRAGVVLEPRSAAMVTAVAHTPHRRATLRRLEDGSWRITSPLGDARVPDTAGIGQLGRLLAAAGMEIASVELSGTGIAPAADLGPVLDERAKRAYRHRLAELRAEVDKADSFHDPARADQARHEIEALMAELRRAVGIGGRDRPSGSGAERARVNVTRSLGRAITNISRGAPELGAHLQVSVQTGRYCRYAPEPAAALAWTVGA